MHKGQTTRGTLLQNVSLKMCVELDGELNVDFYLSQIAGSLRSISKLCDLYPEEDTYIMPVGRTKHSTIVISFEPKKILEKNGVQ